MTREGTGIHGKPGCSCHSAALLETSSCYCNQQQPPEVSHHHKTPLLLDVQSAQSGDSKISAREAVMAYTAGLRRRSDTHGPGAASIINAAAVAARKKVATGTPDGADGVRAVSSYMDNLRRASRVRLCYVLRILLRYSCETAVRLTVWRHVSSCSSASGDLRGAFHSCALSCALRHLSSLGAGMLTTCLPSFKPCNADCISRLVTLTPCATVHPHRICLAHGGPATRAAHLHSRRPRCPLPCRPGPRQVSQV